MTKLSIAQTMPPELLELIFNTVVKLRSAEARAEMLEEEGPPDPPTAMQAGPHMNKIHEDFFVGVSYAVAPFLRVCRNWYRCAGITLGRAGADLLAAQG